LLLAFLGFIDSLGRQRQWLAGLCLSVLALKPGLLFAPVLLLLYYRQWKALLVGGFALVGPLVMMMAVYSPSLWRDYVTALHFAVAQQGSNNLWNTATCSFTGLTYGLGPMRWPAIVLLDLCAVGIWLPIARRRDPLEAACTAPLLGLLISPHALAYDLTISLAALPVLARRPPHLLAPLVVAGLVLPPALVALRMGWLGAVWLFTCLALVAFVPATDAAGPVALRP